MPSHLRSASTGTSHFETRPSVDRNIDNQKQLYIEMYILILHLFGTYKEL